MRDPYQVVLVACSIESSPMAYPLGALCILTALQSDPRTAHRVTSSLDHFLADTDDPEDAAAQVASRGASLVGLSLYLYNRVWFDRFITALCRIAPEVTLFAGGPEAGAKGIELLGMGVHFIALGEGEETVVGAVARLADGLSADGPGILSPTNMAALPCYPQDLSLLASPLLAGTADPTRYPGVLWEMTRGCPYHCAFCFESRGSRLVRQYPDERIERELELLIDAEVTHVFVLDPTFNMDRKRTVRMLTLLARRAPATMHFTFEVRAELLEEETARLFGQVHCSLQIGLQSSSPQVLQAIGRRFDPKVFAEKIALLNSHGVVFGLDLIIGLPHDTLESFRESLDFAISCKPSNLDIFLLALLPGTQLAEDAGSLQLRHQAGSPYLLLESPTMNETDIARALRLKEACDLFYTTGQAVMWFQAACSGLSLRPVELLDSFAEYLQQFPEEEDEDVFSIQDRFIRALYQKHGREELLPALLGFMELHQGISHLQQTGESPVVYLSHDADQLALLDTMQLDEFVSTYPAAEEAQPYWIFMEDGVLFVEPMMG
ncbi:MAG: radical SAM protein [Sphaerochaetaceae bacterium]